MTKDELNNTAAIEKSLIEMKQSIKATLSILNIMNENVSVIENALFSSSICPIVEKNITHLN